MDEMPSPSRNDFNREKVKKKRSKTTEQHDELTVSTQEQTEKRREKKEKRRNSKAESDNNLQTHTGKKKRRKLDNEGETSVMDDGVSNQHEAQTQELQGSREEKPSRRKKKREKAKQTTCEDMAKQQTDIKTEHEEKPNTSDEESDPPDLMITAKKREKKQTPKIKVDLKFLDELKEFFPNSNLESRSMSYIRDILRYDLSRVKEFRKQGIELRTGRFSTAENERLRQNVNDFMALTGVKDAVRLFYPSRFPKEEKVLRKLKKKNRFFERIADGIPRICGDVYDRGSKVFDDRNYKGNFTEEEQKSLIKYYKRYGPNWKKISEKTDRSSRSLEKRFAVLNKRKGPWTTKEVQRLLRAVRDHVVSVLKSANPNKRKPKIVSREILYKNLAWSKISEQVKTRCWVTSRRKWMSILAARMSSWTTFRGRKSLEAKIRFIKTMYEMQVEDVVDVHWEDLTSVFGDVPPAYAQLRWHKLKVYYVPDWKNKCFGDIVDFLYENVLPVLVKECEELDDDDDDDDEDELKVDQMQSFRLADIFQDINEDECCDSDEETGQQEKHSST